MYYEATFGIKKKCPYKKGDIIKEVQFMWNVLCQDKENVTF